MSARRLGYVVGTVLAVTGLVMTSSLVVALVYHEWSDVWPLVESALVAVVLGLIIRRSLARTDELSVREAFAAVAIAWIAATAVGALPYLFTGSIHSVTDAYFESASGFTATGASVVADPSGLSHAVLFWRAITQWLGGMGIVVLAVALSPRLGIGGLRLTEAEAPGPTAERITPRYRDTARMLWMLFVGFTVAESLLLVAGGIGPFDAITHSFTTLSGGGFSTKAASVGAFSAYAQWVVVIFMLVGGTSFALHHRALRHPSLYVRNAEFRLYMTTVALASVFVVIATWGTGLHQTIRDAVFTTSSIITTTGYVTADYGLWIAPVHVLIIGLMFVGAMAGSTSGSIKVYRLEVITGTIRSFGRRLIHPRTPHVVSSGGTVVPEEAVRSIASFFLLYVLAFFAGTIALGVIGSLGSGDIGLVSSASAVASSLGNIGPGLDMVGPATTYALVPTLGKWLLSFLMILGRLEILPVLVLLSREAWRR